MLPSWKEIYEKPTQYIKKQRPHFGNKGPFSQSSMGSQRVSHVQTWELNHKEGWVLKNWCFWTVVLEKTFESTLDHKEIKSVHPKGNQLWISVGRTDAKAEALILGPPDENSRLIGKDPDTVKDWGQEEKRAAEDETVGWHHQVSGHQFEPTLKEKIVKDREAWFVQFMHDLATEQKQQYEQFLFNEWINWGN